MFGASSKTRHPCTVCTMYSALADRQISIDGGETWWDPSTLGLPGRTRLCKCRSTRQSLENGETHRSLPETESIRNVVSAAFALSEHSHQNLDPRTFQLLDYRGFRNGLERSKGSFLSDDGQSITMSKALKPWTDRFYRDGEVEPEHTVTRNSDPPRSVMLRAKLQRVRREINMSWSCRVSVLADTPYSPPIAPPLVHRQTS